MSIGSPNVSLSNNNYVVNKLPMVTLNSQAKTGHKKTVGATNRNRLRKVALSSKGLTLTVECRNLGPRSQSRN